MFCSKCGKEIADGSIFCSICGSSLTASGAKIQPKPKKKRGKLFLVVFAFFVILVIGILAFSPDDYGDTYNSEDHAIEESANIESAVDENPNAQVSDVATSTLEDTLALAKASTSATCELVRDSSQIVSFPSEEFSILMSLMEPKNYTSQGYTYLFNPEYRIVMDSGVSFNIMQDFTAGVAIMKFDGDDTIYTANYDLFKATNLIPTEAVDDFSYLHHFTDGASRDAAIEACVSNSAIFSTAYKYAAANGFDIDFSIDPCYRVDAYDIVPLDDVDPNLVAVYIAFSIIPYSMDGIENSEIFYENEGWLSGGTLYGAFYVDERPEGTRVYPIGMKGMVLDINETSIFEEAITFYENSQVNTLFK